MSFGEIVMWAWAITAMFGLFFIVCITLEAVSDIADMNKIEKIATELSKIVAKVTVILMLVSICMTAVFGVVELFRKMVN